LARDLPVFRVSIASVPCGFLIKFDWNLSPLLEMASAVIQVVFIIDFGMKFLLAPRKLAYLNNN
jgi:voltage-gated potassium channel